RRAAARAEGPIGALRAGRALGTGCARGAVRALGTRGARRLGPGVVRLAHNPSVTAFARKSSASGTGARYRLRNPDAGRAPVPAALPGPSPAEPGRTFVPPAGGQ